MSHIYYSSELKFNLRILTDQKLPWSLDGICYGIVSFISFSTFTFLSYYYYAEEFLEHAHLHHLTRQDTRHNFSVSLLTQHMPKFHPNPTYTLPLRKPRLDRTKADGRTEWIGFQFWIFWLSSRWSKTVHFRSFDLFT